MNKSELLNAEQLDESVSNLINENLLDGLTENTSLLNADGEQFYYATARRQLRNLTGCKKPLVRTKKKLKAYNECMKNYKANLEREKQEAATSAKAEVSKKLQEVEKELEDAKNQTPDSSRVVEGTGDKFLGMPKAVGITVVVVGGLALLIGGIFLVKKLSKK